MKIVNRKSPWFFTAMLIMLLPVGGYAFDSGSTGADGAFNPVVNTQLQLPPDGVFNFTTVNIPSGVNVTFAKNATNTPVTILASGNVTISGGLFVDGGSSTNVAAAGDGNLGDDGLPGRGGPGGFDGGRGASINSVLNRGGNGLGPGGGQGGSNRRGDGFGCAGGGGGFSASGAAGQAGCANPRGNGGTSYGAATLLPLIGGSGGGGGSSGTSFSGSGGGGGGGAVLIASSGTVSINGGIFARGGNSGISTGPTPGGEGGGGSGGAIRIVATTIAGNGAIQATNGVTGPGGAAFAGGSGSNGRIRLEAESFTRSTGTTPTFSFAAPGDVFVAGLPSISITSVAGVAAPASPTGNADITLPESTPNPVTVEFASSNVPVGNTIRLSVLPANAVPVNTLSDALSGTEAAATASATVNLPSGPSTLQASVSFTVTAALGDFFSNFAMGERVERVKVTAVAGQGSQTTFITISGKEFTVPSNAVAMN